MVVGFDPVHARSVQRSFTVHGDEEAAERRRWELVADFGISRVAFASEASRLSVGELLERFFAAPHLWKAATFRRTATSFVPWLWICSPVAAWLR